MNDYCGVDTTHPPHRWMRGRARYTCPGNDGPSLLTVAVERAEKAEAQRDAALARLDLVRALIPYANPELIEDGYGVPADQLILALGPAEADPS